MTEPPVVIPSPPDAPGILHVDTESGKFGPTPTHDVGHVQGQRPIAVGMQTKDDVSRIDGLEETIRHFAYALWEARGHPHGSAVVDWLMAEREVTGRRSRSLDKQEAGGVGDGLNLMGCGKKDLKEDGLTNPNDGRGPLRASDDQGYDSPK